MMDDAGDELYYRTYRSEEEDLSGITRLVDQELSEPYVHRRMLLHVCPSADGCADTIVSFFNRTSVLR